MRVRITKTLTGSIDGIQLSRLSKGQVYDVYTALACCLLADNSAEPAPNDEPTAVLPLENQMFRSPEPSKLPKGIRLPRSLAADRARKRGKRGRDKR